MQRGTTIKHHGSWTLVYFDVRVVKGERKCVPVYKTLARISGEKSPPNSVRVEADKILELINTKQAQPESAALVRDFIEDAYLPWVKANRRPSTYKDCKKDIYDRHDLRSRLGNLRLREAQTVHFQRLIASISKEHPEIGHKTLQRLKSFFSGVFTLAKVEGIISTENPVSDVQVPGRPKKFKVPFYTIPEIVVMAEAV